jgi:hypothetical protein
MSTWKQWRPTNGQDSFEGITFPLVKVKFAGPTDHRGARWIATLTSGRLGGPKSYRVIRPYDYSIGCGATNALPVAQEVLRKCFADWSARTESECPNVQNFILIPCEIDRDTYGFTVIHKRHFA